jgi:hypothetical protein
VLQVGATGHIHVQTRPQRSQGRIPPIACEALDDKVPNGHRITDNEAFETPFPPQNIA